MARLILLIFGLYGIAIGCLQGIEPFIELSKWVAWVSKNWIAFTRNFWEWIFGFFHFTPSAILLDALSGIVYTSSLFLGYRRCDESIKALGVKANKLHDSATNWLEGRTPAFFCWILSWPLFLALFAPFFVVLAFLFAASPVQAITFFSLCYLLNTIDTFFPVSGPRVKYFLIGNNASTDGFEDGDEAAAAFLIVPIIICAVLIVVLLLNEAAVHGDNIIGIYKWAKCDAGIAC